MNAPRTLHEAITFFAHSENCNAFMTEMRWPDGKVHCPTCSAEKVTYLAKAKRWKCYAKHPKQKFSLKVGTMFEDSHAVWISGWLLGGWWGTARMASVRAGSPAIWASLSSRPGT